MSKNIYKFSKLFQLILKIIKFTPGFEAAKQIAKKDIFRWFLNKLKINLINFVCF